MSNKTNYDIMWYENGKTETGYVVTKYDNSIPNDSKMFLLNYERGVWGWKPYKITNGIIQGTYFDSLHKALIILDSVTQFAIVRN
jgi:hypothetical protein